MSEVSPMPLKVGLYRILRRLGADGIVEVYLGEDTNPSYHGDRVAVKRIRPEFMQRDSLYQKGFLAEGETGRNISHPNVVQIYDVVVQDGVTYLVTEYVNGIPLSDLIEVAGGKVEPAVVSEAARQVCEGLAAIHEAKDKAGAPLHIVHQNVTPSSICVNKRGDVKLLDLGIARSKISGHGGARIDAEAPAYLSPEQARGDVNLSAASDQYSVGVVVFEMLSNIPFFDGLEALASLAEKRAALEAKRRQSAGGQSDSLDDVLEDEMKEGSIPFRSVPPSEQEARLNWARRELPNHLHDLEELPGAGLDEILSRMLAYDPAERYPSIRSAGAELLRWAWGTGNAIDFKRFVSDLIAQHQGEEVETPDETPPFDEEAIKEAAESSFVPKSYVLGVENVDSAFLPPPPPQDDSLSPRRGMGTLNLAESPPVEKPPAPPPGSLIGVAAPVVPPRPSLVTPAVAKQASTFPWGRIGMVGVGALILVLLVGVLYLWRDSLGFGGGDSVAVVQEQAPGGNAVPQGDTSGANQEMRNLFESAASSEGAHHPAQGSAEQQGDSQGSGATDSASASGIAGFHGLRGAGEAPGETGAVAGEVPLPEVRDRTANGEVKPLPPEKLVPFKGRRFRGYGSLTVETSPPGAQVILDGVNIERSPVVFERITAGEHQLILRSEELGLRDVLLVELRNGQQWQGTWSFRQGRWLSRE